MIGADAPGFDGSQPGKGRHHTLAEYSQEELIAKWEEFFAEMGYESEIIGLADRYPEARTLRVRFEDMNRFDTDMSIYLLRQPLNVLAAGEEAIRRIVPPTEEALEIHLRVLGLPRDARVQIRDLRAKHLGRAIAVEGLVRKATEVRPMVVDALFQCLRCGTVIKEPQEGQSFREPLECYEDQGGCGKSASSTKFKLLSEASRFLDTQKIEIQEAPEGLRGGEEPQRLAAFMEDDLTGKITPGMRVVLNGILRSSQKGRPGQRSTLFDIFLDANSIELEQVEFEEIEVTEEDIKQIEAQAAQPDIFQKIVASIAPSIYGLTTEKEALALQLFSGVPKVMPDGRRIRGDLHILLVGDPGCVVADERVVLGNGTIVKIGQMGRSHLQPIRTRVRLGAGSSRNARASRFHRYAAQPILEVVTESGKCIQGTHNHPLLVWNPKTRSSEWKRLDELRVGERLRVTPSIRCWKRALVPTGWIRPGYREKLPRVKVPGFVDEGLAAIFGYLLGDGWIDTQGVGFVIAEGENDLAPKLQDLFGDTFGVRPRSLPRDGKITRFRIYRRPIIRWLWSLRVKRVPDVIMQSRNSVVSTFLRWLYDADGSCFAGGRGRTSISLRSAEIELLRDVQVLLLRWGIHGRILWGRPPRPHVHRGAEVRGGPSGSLVIRQAESILRFAGHIGFESAKKQETLSRVVEHAESRSRRWHPRMSERIVSIRPAGFATVYDIEVPGAQRFIANGIISHNTAKSELLSYMSRLSPRGIYATGKAATAAGLCVSGESLLATATGLRPIRDVVEGHFRRAKRTHAIESAPARGEIATIDKAHRARRRPMEVVWRLRSPPTLLEIETAAGRRVRVTPATRLLVDHSMNQSWIPAKFIRRGMRIGTAHSLSIPEQEPPLIFDLLQGINSRIVVDVDPTLVDEIIQRLADRFGSVREAAARLLIDEDALYHRWRDGRHAVPLSALIAVADVANVPKPQLASAIRRYSQAGGHWIRLPQRLDPDLAHFAGLIAGDGSIELGARGGYSIRFNNSEESLVREYCALASRLFGVTPELTPRSPERAASCRFHSALVAAALGHLGIPPSPKSASIIIPEILLNAPGTILSSYLRGLFDTDGSVSVRQVGSSCLSLSTISRRLAEGVQTALLRFGIHARVRTRHVAGRRSIRFDGREIVSRHDQYVVEIRDRHSMTRFRNLIGLSHPAKARKLAEILEGRAHSNVDLISAAGPHLREVRGLLGLGNSQAYRGHRGIGAAIERGSRASTHATLGELIGALEQAYRSGEWEGHRLALSRKLRDAVRDVLRSQEIGSKTLAAKLGISRDRALEYFFRAERRTKRVPIRVLEKLAWLLRTLDADIAALIEAEIRPLQRRIASIPRRLEFLGSLASTDIRWDPVATVRPVPAEEEGTVYDLTVRDAHAFFANGILVHNTAAAVRDEFGEGRWTLEAGALVLADKGLACIDEIDKMNPQDRAAIHEAMEQQRISVAKAGITAVLQARCAILGAANPKFGRFDETKYIGEQIDLPPTLLSRFDAIFSIIDRPESERDRRLADHIIRGHLVGEWLRRREEGHEVPEASVELIEPYAPHFDPVFFRKYVAYAKRVSPVMTPEAMDAIRTKYLEIRKTGEGAGASVPITPRQLEAIIRLSEASARARLSTGVEAEDAERAVRITEYWMRRVAGEEGRFDIDIVQVGISASQREQIITLREIIADLSAQSSLGAADYEDVVRIAGERGISSVRVDQWLKRWAEEGDLYSPAKNRYKLVERL